MRELGVYCELWAWDVTEAQIRDFNPTQLVARRVRELGVYCELWAWDVTEAQIRDFNPSGIILSGGPESTTE